MSQNINRRNFFRSFQKAPVAGAVGTALLSAARAESGLGPVVGPARSLPTSIGENSAALLRPQRILLWENTRREIRESIQSGRLKAAILPTGSIEQHNEHIALVEDVAHATMFAQMVALELYPQVIVAPPSPCGYAPYWMARKGTITLRKETFLSYVFDVLHCLKTHGIRTLLVLNGHGGNAGSLDEAEAGWRKELGVTLEVDSFWRGIPKEFTRTVLETKNWVSHAGEFETSIALAAFPERVRRVSMKQYDDAKLNYESGFSPDVEHFLRIDGRTFKDGRIYEEGENKVDRLRQVESALASAEKGEALIRKGTQYFVDKVERMIAATEAGKPWPITE